MQKTLLSRRPSLTTLLVTVFALLAVVACEATPPVPRPPLRADAMISSIPLPVFDSDEEITLADYEGKVVLMDFWATWCKPCHTQAAILAPLYEEYKDKGVVFLAIDSDEDEATVRRFVEKYPFPYPVVLDVGDKLGLALDILALPTVAVLDPSGEITYLNSGIADAETLRRELDRAGAG